MLRINIGWSEEREAHEIALGLSEANLTRLQQKEPIFVSGESLMAQLPEYRRIFHGNQVAFIIFNSHAEQTQFEQDFKEVCERLTITPEGNISVLNIENNFFVTPVPIRDRMIYFIGLHETSYEKLRKGEILAFRSRFPLGQGQSVEVTVFWGKTEEEMLKVVETLGYKNGELN
jgi:hypothetical protein